MLPAAGIDARATPLLTWHFAHYITAPKYTNASGEFN